MRSLCAMLTVLAYCAATAGMPSGPGLLGGASGACCCGDAAHQSGTCCCQGRRLRDQAPQSCCTKPPKFSCCAERLGTQGSKGTGADSAASDDASGEISICSCGESAPLGVMVNADPRLLESSTAVAGPLLVLTWNETPFPAYPDCSLAPPSPPPEVRAA